MDELYKPKYVANVSGGKDSLYMFALILNEKLPLDEVMTVTLEIENPIEREVKALIKQSCLKNGIKFIELKPSKTYQSLYDKHKKLPKKGDMWCQKEYKQEAMRKYEIECLKKGYRCFNYIGLCADEQSRFYNSPYVLYPLVEYGICENEILEWAKKNPIFHGWYNSFNRLGCTMCPYRKDKELKWLLNNGFDIYSLDNGINSNKLGKGEVVKKGGFYYVCS